MVGHVLGKARRSFQATTLMFQRFFAKLDRHSRMRTPEVIKSSYQVTSIHPCYLFVLGGGLEMRRAFGRAFCVQKRCRPVAIFFEPAQQITGQMTSNDLPEFRSLYFLGIPFYQAANKRVGFPSSLSFVGWLQAHSHIVC